jgi:hypothetical protein
MKWLALLALASLLACNRPKPSEACVRYCTCMEQQCQTTPGYPFADRQSCLGRCATFTAFELKCWSTWCSDVLVMPDARHLCEHAWGLYALDECETQ